MSDWLERAERDQDYKQGRIDYRKKALERKVLIKKNYEKLGKTYKNFINELTSLSNRANNLPPEFREPFGKIIIKSRPSKLENHYHFFGTSRRETKKEFAGSFKKVFKMQHIKHIRVIYFTISSRQGMANIEINERSMHRRKISKDETDSTSTSKSKSSDRNAKVHRVFRYGIEQMDADMARKVLDWLAFRCEKEDIPFFDQDYSVK